MHKLCTAFAQSYAPRIFSTYPPQHMQNSAAVHNAIQQQIAQRIAYALHAQNSAQRKLCTACCNSATARAKRNTAANNSTQQRSK